MLPDVKKEIPKNMLKGKSCNICYHFKQSQFDWCYMRASRPKYDTCKLWKYHIAGGNLVAK